MQFSTAAEPSAEMGLLPHWHWWNHARG